jgi:hypothetical protein
MDSKSSILRELYRLFTIIETSAMGLGAPQRFAINREPYRWDIENGEPGYQPPMRWTMQRPWLPASLSICAGGRRDGPEAKSASMKVEALTAMKCNMEIFYQKREFRVRKTYAS